MGLQLSSLKGPGNTKRVLLNFVILKGVTLDLIQGVDVFGVTKSQTLSQTEQGNLNSENLDSYEYTDSTNHSEISDSDNVIHVTRFCVVKNGIIDQNQMLPCRVTEDVQTQETDLKADFAEDIAEDEIDDSVADKITSEQRQLSSTSELCVSLKGNNPQGISCAITQKKQKKKPKKTKKPKKPKKPLDQDSKNHKKNQKKS